MKNRIHLLTFILLLATSICVAQKESVLRIILPKGNVTVDNSPVKSGQHLTSSSKKLLIDKGSYAYVLTPKGYVMRLGTGNWTIAEIEDFIVKSDRYSKPPAVHRQVEPLEFIGF